MVDSAPASEGDLATFRARVSAWLGEHAPAHGWERPTNLADMVAEADEETRLARARTCQLLLHEAGFAGITWPAEHGGQGLSNLEQVVFNQEAAHYDLPITPFLIGLGMCGPTILAHGTEDQKGRYLRPMLRGEDIWCQMFSEPEAGSDLASLRTRADRDVDEWALSGQKVWTSGAHNARFGMILARSDSSAPKHRGLTMFVVDMTAPGVDIRPLRQMNGTARFNEVFLDRVRPEGVLGDVGDGWRTAITTLMNERVSIGTGPANYGHPPETLAVAAGPAGRSDERRRDQLTQVWIEQRIVQLLGKRTTDALLAGRSPGPEGSVAKLAGTRAAKTSASLAMQLVGPASVAHAPGDTAAHWADVMCHVPGLSIAGGTDEVLRNVIGERVLGLPREPDPDRGRPFRETVDGDA